MHLYHLTSEQQGHLSEEVRSVMQQIMAINFDAPAQDEQNIRHHAYLKGKLATAMKLLEDDFQSPDHTEEAPK